MLLTKSHLMLKLSHFLSTVTSSTLGNVLGTVVNAPTMQILISEDGQVSILYKLSHVWYFLTHKDVAFIMLNVVFAILMMAHTMKDIINGLKLIVLSTKQHISHLQQIRFFLRGLVFAICYVIYVVCVNNIQSR